MRRIMIALTVACILISFMLMTSPLVTSGQEDESDKCVKCHKEKTPFIVRDWASSKHAKAEKKKGILVDLRDKVC